MANNDVGAAEGAGRGPMEGGERFAASEFQQLLIDTEDLTEFAGALAQLAAGRIGPAVACGITMLRTGRPSVRAGSDGFAAELEELQHQHGDGPGLAAIRAGEIIEIVDLSADHRWVRYRARARAGGICSVLAVPLQVQMTTDKHEAALSFSCRQLRAFHSCHRKWAERFVTEAAPALRLAVRLADQTELTDHLEAALASRSVIDQAIGIVMGQNRCDADSAFEILRRASNTRNVKLRDLATQILGQVGGDPNPTDPRFRRPDA